MTLAKLYEVKALLNQARNKTDDAIPYFENLEAAHAAALSQITDLGGQLSAAQADLAAALAEVDSLSDIIAQLQQQSAPPAAPLVVYNEIRSAGSMVAEGLQDILFIYQSDLHPTDDHRAAPDVDHLRSMFAAKRVQYPDAKLAVLDQEEWLKKEVNGTDQNNKFTAVNIPYYVTLVNTAKEFFEDVAVYMFPERYFGFETGGATENAERLADLYDRTADASAIIEAVTFFAPSFYYLNPIHLDAAKRDHWMTAYVDMIRSFAPGKKIMPVLGPAYHMSVPEVELRLTPIPGDYFRATLDLLLSLGVEGIVIWKSTGAPDPRDETPEPAWWTEAKSFVAALPGGT